MSQRDAGQRALHAIRPRAQAELPAEGVHDRAGHRETQPSPLPCVQGGEEGLEDPVTDPRGNAGAVGQGELTCETDPCGADAVCNDLDAGDYECTCATGFSGDGFDCCADDDGDETCNDLDNCVSDANPSQDDFNSDGTGDACDSIVIMLSDLTTTAQFYEYEAVSATVHYFALLDEGGEPHVAVDACDVCYGAKKGYRQDGDEMVCNNCGLTFDIDGIGSENRTGGCNPGYIPIEITAESVIIEPEALEAASWYFE